MTLPPTNEPPYGPIDILPPSFTQTPQLLEFTVKYPSGTNSPDVHTLNTHNSGQRMKWDLTQVQPEVSISGEEKYNKHKYTVLMTDPDAPIPEDAKYAYWRHWIQPGLELAHSTGGVTREALTDYVAPGKKESDATPHRYLFLLLQEPSNPSHPYYSLTKSDVGEQFFEARRKFDVKGWIEKYDLKVVGLVWFWGTG